jgi:hypothetical protein
MAFLTENSIFGLTFFSILILSYLYFTTLTQTIGKTNEKYNRLTYLIVISSFATSLILYGLALYYFSVFPSSGPMFIILTSLVVMIFQLISTTLSQWKVSNIQEYVSGGTGKSGITPGLIASIVLPTILLFISIPYLLATYFTSNNFFTRHFNPGSLQPELFLFATIPILVSFSLYSSTQSFVSLKNITNFYK